MITERILVIRVMTDGRMMSNNKKEEDEIMGKGMMDERVDGVVDGVFDGVWDGVVDGIVNGVFDGVC